MRRILPLIALGAFALSAPALAQPGKEGPSPIGPAGPVDTEKVKLVYVYGDDPCPPEADDEIQICAKMPEQERYRIPKELRGDPFSPQNTSWVQRARSLETVGLSGINSCSTSGAGGFTGCFAQAGARGEGRAQDDARQRDMEGCRRQAAREAPGQSRRRDPRRLRPRPRSRKPIRRPTRRPQPKRAPGSSNRTRAPAPSRPARRTGGGIAP